MYTHDKKNWFIWNKAETIKEISTRGANKNFLCRGEQPCKGAYVSKGGWDPPGHYDQIVPMIWLANYEIKVCQFSLRKMTIIQSLWNGWKKVSKFRPQKIQNFDFLGPKMVKNDQKIEKFSKNFFGQNRFRMVQKRVLKRKYWFWKFFPVEIFPGT